MILDATCIHPLVDIIIMRPLSELPLTFHDSKTEEVFQSINTICILWLQIFHLLRKEPENERGMEGWETENLALAKKLCVRARKLYKLLMKIPYGAQIGNGTYFHYLLQGHVEEMVGILYLSITPCEHCLGYTINF